MRQGPAGDLQGLGDPAPIHQIGGHVVIGPEGRRLMGEDFLEAGVINQGDELGDRRPGAEAAEDYGPLIPGPEVLGIGGEDPVIFGNGFVGPLLPLQAGCQEGPGLMSCRSSLDLSRERPGRIGEGPIVRPGA